jgi:5'-3' exonuclease
MNKILEEFKRIKTQRNQFVNETNKKGEVLLSQAKNKFDSVHNSILSKNFNNKNIENQYEYMDLIKENLTKAIHLKDEIFFYNIFFNDCFKDLMLFIENRIKDILAKNNEPINEEEDFEFIQNIVKLAHLTKVLVEENINIIKGNSSTQKKNLLMQLKENLNIIFNTFSPIANNENGIKNKS